ncbi:MAG: hypothetical protein IJX08_06750 [Clostridia bacterium]|nr:hypothetical protein [Clostridia bacterium]MBQ8399650.1 hypothetical protein [Clostridia bacterium]
MKHEEQSVHAQHRERLRTLIRHCPTDKIPPHMILEFLLSYAIPRRDTTLLPIGSSSTLEAFLPCLMQMWRS